MLKMLLAIGGSGHALAAILQLFYAVTYFFMWITYGDQNHLHHAFGSSLQIFIFSLASFFFFQFRRCISNLSFSGSASSWRHLQFSLLVIAAMDVLSIFLSLLFPQEKRDGVAPLPTDENNLSIFLQFVQQNHAILDAVTAFLIARPYGLFAFVLAMLIRFYVDKKP